MSNDRTDVDYAKLQQLLRDAPRLNEDPVPAETYLWLGRVRRIVADYDTGNDATAINFASENLTGVLSVNTTNKIMAACYRVLARLEDEVSLTLKGKFIAAGSPFDAFSAIASIIVNAEHEVLFADPYASSHILTDLAPLITKPVSIRILAANDRWTATLAAALPSWNSQWGSERPVAVRKAPPKALHDRVIVLDGKSAWSVGQSLKDLAKDTMTTITRLDAETAQLKIEALEDVWSRSTPIT